MRRAIHFALFCLVATGCPAGEDDTDTGNPDDPTDPSDPTDPTDPTDPSDPDPEPVDPLAGVDGDYSLTTTCDLTVDALLPEQVREPVLLLQEFRSQPAATLIRLLDEAGVPLVDDLYAALPSTLEDKLEGWIDGYVDGLPGVTELDRILAMTQLVVTRFDIDSQLSLAAHDGTGRAAATHELRALRYRIDAERTLTVSLAALPLAQRRAATSVQLTATDAGVSAVIADHVYALPYGEYAYQALQQWMVQEYGTDLRGALGELIDCPALAASVADHCVLSVCVGHEQELTAICEAGLDQLAAEVHDQFAANRFEALRLHQGDAAISDAAIAGTWDASLDLGQGPRPLPAAFIGSR